MIDLNVGVPAGENIWDVQHEAQFVTAGNRLLRIRVRGGTVYAATVDACGLLSIEFQTAARVDVDKIEVQTWAAQKY